MLTCYERINIGCAVAHYVRWLEEAYKDACKGYGSELRTSCWRYRDSRSYWLNLLLDYSDLEERVYEETA